MFFFFNFVLLGLETFCSASVGFITKDRLQSSQNGKLVKVIWWGKKWRLQCLQLTVSLWCESRYTNSQSLRSYKWSRILNWSKWILVTGILNHILLTVLPFIALQFCERYNLFYKASPWCVLIYVNVQFTPRRVINGSHIGEQNLSLIVCLY